MYLDLTHVPQDQTFAKYIAEKLGVYVKVADFTEHNGKRIFRMIVDPELYKSQMRTILFLGIKDKHKSYEFAWLESIPGPVVDNGPQRSEQTAYLRITFL